MAAKLASDYAVDIEYIESSGGAFEVAVEGNLIFSKKKERRFPEYAEILTALQPYNLPKK